MYGPRSLAGRRRRVGPTGSQSSPSLRASGWTRWSRRSPPASPMWGRTGCKKRWKSSTRRRTAGDVASGRAPAAQQGEVRGRPLRAGPLGGLGPARGGAGSSGGGAGREAAWVTAGERGRGDAAERLCGGRRAGGGAQGGGGG